ncbi:signal transduction histidine kinase [Blastococcus colisei]|uniref:histidine kinase n=1 Tax=Blastococcus colisei TaxID=1564162 RepID=A0A543PCS6_9ACTN|nr:histidine kinase [Blastococcus colisei]TQN41876.1 signal transduction histidine kinase [Blastococcus colisei]
MDESRRRPALPIWSDVVLAAAFLAVSAAQIAVAPIAGPVVSVVVALGCTVPIAWRRTAPAAAALAMTAVWIIPTPEGYLLLGYVIAAVLYYSLGAYEPRPWRVVVVTAVGVTVGVVVTLLGPEIWQAAIGSVLAVAGPAAAGRLVAHQRAQNARLEELTEQLVQERTAAERAAAAEERARIARELHDVIGHEVTVIALQADAAAAALAKAPERAAAPVAAIRRSAAEALDEMRRVVGMLRAAEEDDDLRPQPGLTDLPALVERTRSTDTDVVLDLRPPQVPVPQSVQVAVYRVVQESLTNARRHAPGSAVRVRVDVDAGAVCVEVVSSGGGQGRTPGGGHGLAGMHERVRMHGGELEAGPTVDGFAVSARLPLGVRAAP